MPCMCVFERLQAPFALQYGRFFIMFEGSSVFLNLMWLTEKVKSPLFFALLVYSI